MPEQITFDKTLLKIFVDSLYIQNNTAGVLLRL